MKVIDADTMEEFDYSEIESRFKKWFEYNYEDLIIAHKFYQATTQPPGTPMPDLYTRMAKRGFMRDPTIEGSATGRFHLKQELDNQWARDRLTSMSKQFEATFGPIMEGWYEETKSRGNRNRYRRVGRSHCGCQNRGGNRAGQRRRSNRSYHPLGHPRRSNSRIVG